MPPPPPDLPPARLAAQGAKVSRIVRCREYPFQARPVPGLAHLLSERDVVEVLNAAVPSTYRPSVGTLLHELKLWGPAFAFQKNMYGFWRTGAYVVETLLHDKLCVERTTFRDGSFLIESPYGVRVELLGVGADVNGRAEAHFGQLLKALGQANVASQTPVIPSSGRASTIDDLFQDAVLRYSHDHEPEFFACALAHWQSQAQWSNEFGEVFDFDQITNRLLDLPEGNGACAGCHVPYALVYILRLDEQQQVLSPEVRDAAMSRVKVIARMLEQRASPSGGWDKSWSGARAPSETSFGDALLDRLMVTGHHLEWIALAPTTLRPSHVAIGKSVNAIVADVKEFRSRGTPHWKTYPLITHAARAVSLIRCEDPFVLWNRWWQAGKLRSPVIAGRGTTHEEGGAEDPDMR